MNLSMYGSTSFKTIFKIITYVTVIMGSISILFLIGLLSYFLLYSSFSLYGLGLSILGIIILFGSLIVLLAYFIKTMLIHRTVPHTITSFDWNESYLILHGIPSDLKIPLENLISCSVDGNKTSEMSFHLYIKFQTPDGELDSINLTPYMNRKKQLLRFLKKKGVQDLGT